MRDQAGTGLAVGMQWLVSVRNLAEAVQTDAFGVDILDLKEPRLGPLSPVSSEIWREISQWSQASSAPRPKLSAALGEPEQAQSIADQLPAEFSFAKAGPSGCDRVDKMEALWQATRNRLPDSVELVAVAYADHQAAGTLPAEQILSAAVDNGFRRILLDTFKKQGRSAVQCLGANRLMEFGRFADQHQLWWSLAGSINLQHLRLIPTLFPDPSAAPDCVAVRGDVCESDRSGALSRCRLQAWKDQLSKRASSSS